jgi:RNA polymerase sigma-70 factor (ECF subfamily)
MRNATTSSNSYHEPSLILKASNGDLDAFNQLVLQYQDLAYHHAYALLGDPAQAEDATQESFIKAFQALNTLRGVSFRGWLLKIVTNSAYDLMRRAQRHPTQALYPEDENGEEVESAAWLVDPTSDVQDIVEEHERSSQIYQALDELPEAFRSVLTLIDVNDMDYTEAAEVLGVPLGTVKSRLARARLQMRGKLSSSVKKKNHLVSTRACFAG